MEMELCPMPIKEMKEIMMLSYGGMLQFAPPFCNGGFIKNLRKVKSIFLLTKLLHNNIKHIKRKKQMNPRALRGGIPKNI